MRKYFYPVYLFIVLSSALPSEAQELPITHDPKSDSYLSPSRNKIISPDGNAAINPQKNWNINPVKNMDLNPLENTRINPRFQVVLNPVQNRLINPMIQNSLHPGNPTWSGYYMFNRNDELIGYLSQPSQQVLLCFDKNGNWTCYYVKALDGIYNLFTMDGEWSGDYICYDSKVGYNQFNREGTWTGVHIK